MGFFKEFIAVWTLLAVVSAQYNPYQQQPYKEPYRETYRDPYRAPEYNREPNYNQNKVKLHKLCGWNVIKYDEYLSRDLYRDDSWDQCKLDSGRAWIPENNIPNGFDISSDRRVFVVNPRNRLGVYSNLAYFRIDDIKDEVCPPLIPFPPHVNQTLNTQCCTKGNLLNVNRFYIDPCNRLWAVDKQAMKLNDKAWVHGSPVLHIYDLNTDTEIRRVTLPLDVYSNWQLYLNQIIVNADANDCNNVFAYILDGYNGCVIVYSYQENRFWRACSSEFGLDAKYSKFQIKNRKNQEITYYKDNFITDCSHDTKNQQLLCHSDCQLDEYTIPFADLTNEANARCAPNSLNVKYLGQKCKNCQVLIHTMNRDKQVVWGIQEQNYGVGCWNRENPLNPDAVKLVVSDLQKLPGPTDIIRTDVDLSYFLDRDDYMRKDRDSYEKETYVVTLTNNLQSIQKFGLDEYEENFAFYFFVEDEALEKFPQCLQRQRYEQPSSYVAPQKPYQPQQKPYQPPQYSPRPQPPYQAPVEYKQSYRYKKSDEISPFYA